MPTDEGILVIQVRPTEYGDFRYTLHERDGEVVTELQPGARCSPGEVFSHEGRRFLLLIDAIPAGHRFANPRFDGYAVLASEPRAS